MSARGQILWNLLANALAADGTGGTAGVGGAIDNLGGNLPRTLQIYELQIPEQAPDGSMALYTRLHIVSDRYNPQPFVGGGGGGGGNYAGTWNAGNSYTKGAIVRVTSGASYNSSGGPVLSTVGVFGCVADTTGQSGLEVDPNQIPQFPEPASGIKYWECISLAFQPVSVCVGGGNETIYVQSTSPF
jgi:hypothetical protein